MYELTNYCSDKYNVNRMHMLYNIDILMFIYNFCILLHILFNFSIIFKINRLHLFTYSIEDVPLNRQERQYIENLSLKPIWTKSSPSQPYLSPLSPQYMDHCGSLIKWLTFLDIWVSVVVERLLICFVALTQIGVRSNRRIGRFLFYCFYFYF